MLKTVVLNGINLLQCYARVCITKYINYSINVYFIYIAAFQLRQQLNEYVMPDTMFPEGKLWLALKLQIHTSA